MNVFDAWDKICDPNYKTKYTNLEKIHKPISTEDSSRYDKIARLYKLAEELHIKIGG